MESSVHGAQTVSKAVADRKVEGSIPLFSASFIKDANMFFGYHLLLDCGSCDIEKISSRENIYNFVKTLVERIDMVAVGEPIIEYMCVGDPKVGYSLMQLISTSNITAHFMEVSGQAYFDIFSCKEYDIKIAEECVREFFLPEKVRVNFLTRDAG